MAFQANPQSAIGIARFASSANPCAHSSALLWRARGGENRGEVMLAQLGCGPWLPSKQVRWP